MPFARIIDETGREGIWTDALKDVLAAAGFGLTGGDDESAGLTILLRPEGEDGTIADYAGDLLVLSVPFPGTVPNDEAPMTEVTGSHRLKVRHRLEEQTVPGGLVDEFRPLVNLFLA